jgi:hypothetical protein
MFISRTVSEIQIFTQSSDPPDLFVKKSSNKGSSHYTNISSDVAGYITKPTGL